MGKKGKINQKATWEIIGELFPLIIKLNKETEHDFFIEYSGHVDSLNIRYHKNGWHGGAGRTDIADDLYLDCTEEFEESELRKELLKIKEKLNELK